ncbi:MAG: hypothetical protein AUH30_01375 [Candidatus Rokubacteria bacterium 13_1_40CM_68_15]|nr:MAG: hypothetical protein AUH30_01375 [Candidatus Rokubacteria bacterium 13_1_40CM_68_15]
MRPTVLAIAALLLLASAAAAIAAPEGQITWAAHVTLSAIHDAVVKPMPGNPLAPCLAQAWSVSKDGLDDVKFSFERYRGNSASLFKSKVARVEVVDLKRVRFHLKQAWPDFMTFYATSATGAAYVVPKKYLERVGDEGFKKHPIGAGPYRFVAFKPGIELTLEAFDGYWRKTPSVKTLVMRAVPDETTRLAALKRGEVDVAYSITGPLAEELRRTPGLTLVPTIFTFNVWLLFTDQWDPRSPWHDRRVRLAANHAIDRQAINQAVYLGLGKVGASFIPSAMEYYWAPPAYTYDVARAKQLLAEAGYPNGFDAGELSGDMVYGSAIGEPVAGFLQAVGIRARLRLIERTAFFKEQSEKKLRHVVQTQSGVPGNAATRIEQYAVSGGYFTYGTYPEIDGLFAEQASETNARARQQILIKLQQVIHDRAMFGPIIEPAFLTGVGPRLEVHGLNAMPNHPYSAPYEDLKLKAR